MTVRTSASRLVGWLDRRDRGAYARVAAQPVQGWDPALRQLSRAADGSRLWMVVAVLMGLSGRPALRRAGLRGLASIAVASPAATVLGKQLFRRPRPDLAPVPLLRVLRRPTRTSSFPSGHSASAAAFAVGVAQESLAAAAPVGVLSAAVAASRVRNGAHYPADVIAGVGLGAAASLLVRRWWPVRPREAARAAPADAEVPALPDGTGLVLVANAGSGSLKDSTEALEELAAALPGMSIIEVGPQQDLAAELSSAARCARVLGVAGGDGTVQAAAAVALERALPLAVFPGGTLNHFAGDLGVTGVADLVGAVQCGQGVRVDVGSADGDVFINTASIGTYPDMVAERERLESRLGKWPALAVAALRVLRHGTPLHVTVDGRARRVWLLFAGTSSYEPLGLGASWRPDLAAGRLDLRMLVADRRLARTRLVLALATNQVARCRVLETWQAAQVVLGGEVRLARDGEVEDGLRQGVTLSVAPTALVVLRPEGATRG